MEGHLWPIADNAVSYRTYGVFVQAFERSARRTRAEASDVAVVMKGAERGEPLQAAQLSHFLRLPSRVILFLLSLPLEHRDWRYENEIPTGFR